MKHHIPLLLLAIALAGCAPGVISSSARTVVVRSQSGIAQAQPIADSECAKHGRKARYVGTDRAITQLVFDCVL